MTHLLKMKGLAQDQKVVDAGTMPKLQDLFVIQWKKCVTYLLFAVGHGGYMLNLIFRKRRIVDWAATYRYLLDNPPIDLVAQDQMMSDTGRVIPKLQVLIP